MSYNNNYNKVYVIFMIEIDHLYLKYVNKELMFVTNNIHKIKKLLSKEFKEIYQKIIEVCQEKYKENELDPDIELHKLIKLVEKNNKEFFEKKILEKTELPLVYKIHFDNFNIYLNGTNYMELFQEKEKFLKNSHPNMKYIDYHGLCDKTYPKMCCIFIVEDRVL